MDSNTYLKNSNARLPIEKQNKIHNHNHIFNFFLKYTMESERRFLFHMCGGTEFFFKIPPFCI